MKKTIFIVLLMIFTMSTTMAFADNRKSASDNPVVTDKKENKLSEEEITRLTKRVEEIRDMDKSELTVKEKRELRKELREIKENVRRSGGTIYIGAGTLLLIIILVILLV